MTPKVKICGITNVSDALQAAWHGADALGFVFYKKSKRYISQVEAKKIIAVLPPWMVKVGVFVNERPATVKKIVKHCALDFVQLHGDEDKEYLQKLSPLRIIKAIRIKDRRSLANVDSLPCELVLLDTYASSEFGGTGRRFDWRLAKSIKGIRKPHIISGGLTPRNVRQAVKMFRPYAVDVSSGVEIKPGKKDKQLIKEFIANAKEK